jgi:hypothetical protein
MKRFATAIRDRPWIWLIIANVAIITALTTLGVIAHKHAAQFAPVIPAPSQH